MAEQTLETTQTTEQSAQSQTNKSAPATTEESTLLGSKEANATVGGQKTLLNEGATEGEKKDTEAAKSTTAPEKYDFKVPEGMSLDQVAIDKFTPVFKDLGLNQEQAQKLVDAYAPYVSEQVKAQQEASINFFKETVKEWRDQSIKELGANYAKELSFAARAIDKANVSGLRELMEETGVGNHPAMIKFMIHYGKMVSQDSFVDSTTKKNSLDTIEQKAESLYPSMKK